MPNIETRFSNYPSPVLNVDFLKDPIHPLKITSWMNWLGDEVKGDASKFHDLDLLSQDVIGLTDP